MAFNIGQASIAAKVASKDGLGYEEIERERLLEEMQAQLDGKRRLAQLRMLAVLASHHNHSLFERILGDVSRLNLQDRQGMSEGAAVASVLIDTLWIGNYEVAFPKLDKYIQNIDIKDAPRLLAYCVGIILRIDDIMVPPWFRDNRRSTAKTDRMSAFVFSMLHKMEEDRGLAKEVPFIADRIARSLIVRVRDMRGPSKIHVSNLLRQMNIYSSGDGRAARLAQRYQRMCAARARPG